MTDSSSHPPPPSESVDAPSSDFAPQRRVANAVSTFSEPGSSSHTPARSGRPSRKNRPLVVPADTILTFSSYHPPSNDDGPSTVRTSNHKRGPTRTAPRPREQFVQSNYRFAVDPSAAAALRPSQLFADAHVPWNIVDLVFVPHESDCPICLHPLRCPRVTPCGHVFDYVCMLQLFAHDTADARQSRCPLCAHRITESVLKPCAFTTSAPPVVGKRMAFRLISRLRTSMVCHPFCSPPAADVVPIVMSAAAPLYSRFAYADRSFLLDLIAKSMNALNSTMHEDPSLTPFVSTAVSNIKEWKNAIRARSGWTHHSGNVVDGDETSVRLSVNVSSQSITPLEDFKAEDSLRNSSHEIQETGMKVTGISPEHSPQTSRFNNMSRWYFYQDSNSGNVFLHPINHRCLVTEFCGNFDAAINLLEGEILQTDRYTMDEQLRRRYRFLEHLPIGCEFMFVELDLRHLLSENTLATHKAELRFRKAARRKKEIAHAKETKRVEREQSKSLREYFNSEAGMIRGISPLRESVDRNDLVSFPALNDDGQDTSSALGSNIGTNNEVNVATVEPESSDSVWGPEVSSYSSVTSNMGLFPHLGSSPQNTSTLRSAWGPSSQASSPQADRTRCSNSSNAVDSRKGRKSHGKTTILLSNAGSQARR